MKRSDRNGRIPLHPDCPERRPVLWVASDVTRSLSSLLSPERIRVGLRVDSKDDVLREMVRLVENDSVVLDPVALLRAVQSREALISTGVGQGLGLPHARTSAVSGTVLAFATLEEPVDYDALDGRPVQMVVLLAGPERERGEHVRLLSRISRVVADATIRNRLLKAESVGGVLDAIADAETSLA